MTKRILLLLLLFISCLAVASPQETVLVSLPGPGNLTFLPLMLVGKIGADREEGIRLEFQYTGGGPVSLDNLARGVAEFAAAGAPAAMTLRAKGEKIMVIAPINNESLFMMVIRADLKGAIRGVADLEGRAIGVTTGTRQGKTASRYLAEQLLTTAGVPLASVRFVPVGQSWLEQSSAIVTGSVDAIMADLDIAYRLRNENMGIFRFEPDPLVGIVGGDFLRGCLVTREDVIKASPERVRKLVNMLRKALLWIDSHSPEEIVQKMGLSVAEERSAVLAALRDHPRAFSRDGRFLDAQLKATEDFFHLANPGDAKAQVLSIESMIDARWAGRQH